MATMLGDPSGQCDILSLTDPTRVEAIHNAYIDAGADIIRSNTFNSSRRDAAIPPEAIYAALKIARRAASGAQREIVVAASVGPGNRWADVIEASIDAGADTIILETVLSTDDMRHAIAQIDGRLPVAASAFLGRDRKLYDGTHATEFLHIARDSGADYAGFNCGTDPTIAIAAISTCSDIQTIIFPGILPDTPPDIFATEMSECHPAIAGGCCGTTPAHIAALAETYRRNAQ